MESFRLLHLSDFHIAVQQKVIGFPDWKHLPAYSLGYASLSPSSYDSDLAKAVAKHAFVRGNQLDAILITGDLATVGYVADLDLAHEFVHSPGLAAPLPGQPPWTWAPWLNATGFPTLESSGAPVVLLPGNHDRFNGWWMHAGGRAFDAIFAGDWDGNRKAQTLIVLQLGKENLAVIAADFTLQRDMDADTATGGRWAYMGQGRVYRQVLMDLIQETKTQRSQHESLAVIWALHFPPEFALIDPVLRLLDEHLLVAANQFGVAHLFCGHTHEPRAYALASDPAIRIFCAGTATQYCAPPPNTNSIHPLQIDVDSGTITSVHWTSLQWNPIRMDFV
jgi:3',5'-cyclic AMP phosphodiesterase CpdA